MVPVKELTIKSDSYYCCDKDLQLLHLLLPLEKALDTSMRMAARSQG